MECYQVIDSLFNFNFFNRRKAVMENFQCGKQVQLKSSGPVMTVQEVGDYVGINPGVLCVWFDPKGGTFLNKVFRPEMLDPA